MKAAYQKAIINPDLPVHMDGYHQRISHEINDDIELRSFVIKEKETVLIHVLDVLLISEELSSKFKKRLSNEFNLKIEDITLIASHTHSGPKVSKYLFPNVEPSYEYLENIEEKLVENTKDCLDNLIPADTYYGKTFSENLYSNRTDKNLPYNNNLLTIQFRNEESRPLFQVVNIACHPTILDPQFKKISNDLFGAFRTEFEKKTKVPLVIINGEAGDVSTRYTRRGTDYNEVLRIGKELATLLSEIEDYSPISLNNLSVNKCEYNHTFNPKLDEDLQRTKHDLTNSLEKIETIDRNNAIVDLLKAVEAKLEKEEIKQQYTAKIIETDDFRMVTFPGEIVTALGSELREASEKITFIAAYADDFKGYAINKEAYGEIPETYTTDFPMGIADDFVNQITKKYIKNE
jgi:hypothetical protein